MQQNKINKLSIAENLLASESFMYEKRTLSLVHKWSYEGLVNPCVTKSSGNCNIRFYKNY